METKKETMTKEQLLRNTREEILSLLRGVCRPGIDDVHIAITSATEPLDRAKKFCRFWFLETQVSARGPFLLEFLFGHQCVKKCRFSSLVSQKNELPLWSIIIIKQDSRKYDHGKRKV